MKEQTPKMNLASLDSLFTTQEERDNIKKIQISNLAINKINDFPNHPFKVIDDEDMDKLVISIEENGILSPTIVREKDDGSYEMIAGHRRKHAA